MSGWVCVRSRTLWVSPTNSPRSFFCPCNSYKFFHPEVLRLYFITLESWVAGSVLLPRFSSQFIHMHIGTSCSTSCHLASPSPPATNCQSILSTQLLVSTPLSSLDGCFFFNSSIVGLPYGSISWKFWLFFIFKFVVVLLVVQGGTVHLPTPPSSPEVMWSKLTKKIKHTTLGKFRWTFSREFLGQEFG